MLVGQGWEEAKLHEHPNEYVESLCNYMAMLWCSLYNAKNIPRGAVEYVWAQALEGAFLCFLEGFSRVPYCSTEGRSLMSMDVACFGSEMRGRAIQERLQGHATAPIPPTVATIRGVAYVDTYIKTFYFPPMVGLVATNLFIHATCKRAAGLTPLCRRMHWDGSRRTSVGISKIIWSP